MMSTRLLLILMFASPLHAQERTPWRIQGGVTISHFQQQVKTEIGGPTGERLVNEFQFGVFATGTYTFTGFLGGGIFMRADFGERAAGRFNGFDASGKARVKDVTGGTYTEFWLGPLVRVFWKQLSAEVGYAVVGVRKDNARSDLPSSTGDTGSAFTTHPTIAWMIALGGDIPVSRRLDIALRIEWRIRYYNERGGNSLANNIQHGTQSIAPLFAVCWKL